MKSKNTYIEGKKKHFEDIDSLNKTDAKKQIDLLREAIRYHNKKYYQQNSSVISDRLFDKYFERLKKLENEFPQFDSSISPTRRLGAEPLSQFKKVKHKDILLSLNSVYQKKEIQHFLDFIDENSEADNMEYILEPKLDGFSVEVVYEEGRFSYGSTRGDGETGEDISQNLKTIKTLPLHLDGEIPSLLAIRGEVIMSRKGFYLINKEKTEKGEDVFANPRNAAAGLMRNLDSSKVAGQPLDLYFYELVKGDIKGVDNHWEILEQLKKWGVKTNPLNRKVSAKKKIFEYQQELLGKREDLDYEIDGLVIKANSLNFQRKTGQRERSPRWAIAWKFEPEKQETKILDIIVQVGRTGILTPVALLDPVEVGGVTISRATLHNEDEIRRKQVAVGDKVKIQRAGDVIPEVESRVEKIASSKRKEFEMPMKCPVCKTKTIREGAYVICPAGLNCRAQLKGHLKHFVSRGAMNIENLGEKNIDQLVEKEMIKSLPDLYRLEPDDFKKLDGFADKSAQKMHSTIHDEKEVELHTFLYALGIRHVGKHVAKLLTRHFSRIRELKNAKREEIEKIEGIGAEIAESIENFFSTEKNIRTVDELFSLGIHIKSGKKKVKQNLTGKTFVITGSLNDYSRSQAKKEVEEHGGHASSSVSANTDYLVAGENPGKKLDDAKENEVEIIDEEKFKQVLTRNI